MTERPTRKPIAPENRLERWPSHPSPAPGCNVYLVYVRPHRIGFMNAILESYEWLGRIRTMDRKKGVLELTVVRDWDALFHQVMKSLESELIAPIRDVTPEREDAGPSSA